MKATHPNASVRSYCSSDKICKKGGHIVKTIDMRFDQRLVNSLVGQIFEKYRSDTFLYTDTVTATAGLFVSGRVFELRNEQEPVDYFGTSEDCAVFRIAETSADRIRSFFDDTEQTDTPVGAPVDKIVLINENQKTFSHGEQTYDVWLTRGIVFYAGGREIAFIKDPIPFSEQIEIRRGYDLSAAIPENTDFLEGWPDGITAEISRQIVEIK